MQALETCVEHPFTRTIANKLLHSKQRKECNSFLWPLQTICVPWTIVRASADRRQLLERHPLQSTPSPNSQFVTVRRMSDVNGSVCVSEWVIPAYSLLSHRLGWTSLAKASGMPPHFHASISHTRTKGISNSWVVRRNPTSLMSKAFAETLISCKVSTQDPPSNRPEQLFISLNACKEGLHKRPAPKQIADLEVTDLMSALRPSRVKFAWNFRFSHCFWREILVKFSVALPNPGKRSTENFTKFSRQISRHLWQRKTEKIFTSALLHQGKLKVTELRWQRAPKTQIFAENRRDFRRFTTSPGNSRIWRAQETAENRRSSQKTEDFCRKPQETADWAPSP